MKHLLLATFGLSMSLGTSLALAQPPEPPMHLPPAGIEMRDPFVPPVGELSLSLHYHDVDIIALLQKISVEGNVEIIVHGDVSGKIKQINLGKVSPETAIERVAQLAGLDWKVDKKTYIVSQKGLITPTDKKAPRLSVNFVDVPVLQVLKLIGQMGNIQLSISDDVTEKLQLIRLNNETPESAIEKVAQAANLLWRKDENNKYIITRPNPD